MRGRNPHSDISVPCSHRAGPSDTRSLRSPNSLFPLQRPQGKDQHPMPGHGCKLRSRRRQRQIFRDRLYPEAMGSSADEEERAPTLEASAWLAREICSRFTCLDVSKLPSSVSSYYRHFFFPRCVTSIDKYIFCNDGCYLFSGILRTQRSICLQ